MDLGHPRAGFGVCDVFVADEERLEQGLVDESTNPWRGFAVPDVLVLQQLKGLIERLARLLGIVGSLLGPAFCL